MAVGRRPESARATPPHLTPPLGPWAWLSSPSLRGGLLLCPPPPLVKMDRVCSGLAQKASPHSSAWEEESKEGALGLATKLIGIPEHTEPRLCHAKRDKAAMMGAVQKQWQRLRGVGRKGGFSSGGDRSASQLQSTEAPNS